jgi:hypothetical protein
MAKMWYTPEEAQGKLGCSADELKDMVKDGLLREFRDAPNKIIYKVEEVDALAMSDLSSTGSGEIHLASEPEDTSGSMTGIPLGDTGMASGLDLSAGTGPLPADTADHIGLEDTGSAESPDDTVVTSHGVNVLDDTDEQLSPVDPHAQTQIAPDLQDLDDQVALDGGGSGSGLLDLSREADDTSLGAELLEEIYPGSEDEGAIETQVPGGFELPTDTTTSVGGAQAQVQAVPVADFTSVITVEDPTSAWYGAMMFLPFLVLLLLSVITAAVATDVQPGLLDILSKNIWIIIGGCGGLTLVIFLMGTFFAGRTPTPKAPRATKPKKTRKK